MDGELRTLHGTWISAIHAGMTTFGLVKPETLQSRSRQLIKKTFLKGVLQSLPKSSATYSSKPTLHGTGCPFTDGQEGLMNLAEAAC